MKQPSQTNSNATYKQRQYDNKLKQSIQCMFVKDILQHLSYLFQKIIVYQSRSPEDIENATKNKHQIRMREEEEHDIENNQDSIEILSIQEISNFQSVQKIDRKNATDHNKQKDRSKKQKIIKKIKKPKTNDPTKKPVSSFVFFYKDRVKTIKLENKTICQSLNSGNLAKIISNQWKKLTDKQKQPYVLLSKQSLKTYYAEKENEKMRAQCSKKIKNQDQDQVQQDEQKNIPSQDKIDIEQEDRDDEIWYKTALQNLLNSQQIQQMTNSGKIEQLIKYFDNNYSRLSRKYNEYNKKILLKHAFKQWNFLLNKIEQNDNEIYNGDSEQDNSQNGQQDDNNEFQSRKRKVRRFKKKILQQQQQYKPRRYYRDIFPTTKNQEVEKQSMMINKAKNQMNGQNCQEVNKNKAGCLLKQSQIKQQISGKQKYLIQQSIKDQNRYTIIELNSNDEIMDDIIQKNDIFIKTDQFSLIQKRPSEAQSLKKTRKPTSPFLIYYQDVLKTLMSNNEKTHGSELVKLASTMWGGLTDEQKQIYHELAKKNRQNIETDTRELNEMKTRKRNRPMGLNN